MNPSITTHPKYQKILQRVKAHHKLGIRALVKSMNPAFYYEDELTIEILKTNIAHHKEQKAILEAKLTELLVQFDDDTS